MTKVIRNSTAELTDATTSKMEVVHASVEFQL